jgi:hypothetical protein
MVSPAWDAEPHLTIRSRGRQLTPRGTGRCFPLSRGRSGSGDELKRARSGSTRMPLVTPDPEARLRASFPEHGFSRAGAVPVPVNFKTLPAVAEVTSCFEKVVSLQGRKRFLTSNRQR